MFVRLLVLFSIVPLVELALLIQVGRFVGLIPTILTVCVTGVAGAYLAKSQGFKLLREVSENLQQGQLPADHLIEGLLVLVGGILLLTPGLVTDLSGFIVLIPFTRRLIARWGKQKFLQWIEKGSMYFSYGEYGRPDEGREAETDPPDRDTQKTASAFRNFARKPEAGEKGPIDVEFEDIRE